MAVPWLTSTRRWSGRCITLRGGSNESIPSSIQLLPQNFVYSCWISVDDYWIKMYQGFIIWARGVEGLCHALSEIKTLPVLPRAAAVLPLKHLTVEPCAKKNVSWEWWWWWCSGAIVFLWISYWEAPDEHRGGLTAIGRKNTSFWPRTHRLTGDQRPTSDCGFCVLQLWI